MLGGCDGPNKNSFLTISTLGSCGGLKRTDFYQFLCWEGAVALKKLIFNNFYFGIFISFYVVVKRTDF